MRQGFWGAPGKMPLPVGVYGDAHLTEAGYLGVAEALFTRILS
jgi:hypothetical protein